MMIMMMVLFLGSFSSLCTEQPKVVTPVEDTRKKASMFFHSLVSEVATPVKPLEEVAVPVTDLSTFERELESFFAEGDLV